MSGGASMCHVDEIESARALCFCIDCVSVRYAPCLMCALCHMPHARVARVRHALRSIRSTPRRLCPPVSRLPTAPLPFALCVVRSPWDLTQRYEEFLRFLAAREHDAAATGLCMCNAPAVLASAQSRARVLEVTGHRARRSAGARTSGTCSSSRPRA